MFWQKEKKVKIRHLLLGVLLTIFFLAGTVIFFFWYIWHDQPKGALVVPRNTINTEKFLRTPLKNK